MLVQDNAAKLGLSLPVVAADGAAAPFRPASFDAVLLDAPCSGLGALRRRADAALADPGVRHRANWPNCNAGCSRRAHELVAPGGRLIYSVCTITAAESVDHPTPDGFEVYTTPPSVGSWRPYEQGWRVLPHDADTDGMVLIRYRRAS